MVNTKMGQFHSHRRPQVDTTTEPYVEVDCSPPLIWPNLAPAPAIQDPAPAIQDPAPAIQDPAPAIPAPVLPAPAPQPTEPAAIIHQAPAAEEEDDLAWATPPASPASAPRWATPGASPPTVADPTPGPSTGSPEPTPGPSGPPTPLTTLSTAGPYQLARNYQQVLAGVTRTRDNDQIVAQVPEQLLQPTKADKAMAKQTGQTIRYATRARLEREGIVLPGDILSQYPDVRASKKS